MRCDLDCEKLCAKGMPCSESDAQKLYADPEERRMMRAASEVEAEHYGEYNRIEEIICFAKKMGYKKLGVAFCVAFSEEASRLCKLLEKYFEIESVCCKTGGVTKESIGAKQSDRVGAISCNPIEQAAVLERAGTELNILLGLCVGHDALFIKHSHCCVVPCAVKDRVMAHNPMGALYCSAIYKRMLNNADKENAD